MRAAGLVATAAVVLVVVAVACDDTTGSPTGPPDPEPPRDPVIVTFEVAGGERFRALLTDPVDVGVAERLLAGEDAPSIPNGRVIRETGVNDGYSWSVDPDDFEFAELTIEGCDGIPSDVEAGVVTSDRYCPWSAVVISIEPAEPAGG
jgi:hypothetical protein